MHFLVYHSFIHSGHSLSEVMELESCQKYLNMNFVYVNSIHDSNHIKQNSFFSQVYLINLLLTDISVLNLLEERFRIKKQNRTQGFQILENSEP